MHWYQTSPERRAITYAKHTAWRQTKAGRFNVLAKDARSSSRKRGLTCDITTADVIAQFEKQNGLCAYTGWPMDFTTKSETLISIERVDNAIGYTPDNIVLVCWCVNKARGGMTQQRFFEMCLAVANGSLSHYKKV